MDRFKNKYFENVYTGCFDWIASKHSHGYGWFAYGSPSKAVMAHRVAWELENGPIPKGMHVLHKCDNPGCVNPEHLFLGTQKDNNADSVAKERHVRGERTGGVKLTEDDVRQIRESSATSQEIADSLGVTYWAINDVRRKRSWGWLK